MTTPKPNAPPAAGQMPLPGRQFQRFILIFHVAFVAGMLLVLLSRWRRTGFVLDGSEALVGILVLLQVAGYIRLFAWPAAEGAFSERLAFYFPVCFSLWFITWRLEPMFEWVALGYLGQMFGAVPPRFSIPGAAVVFVLYLPTKFGWEGLAKLGVKEWLGYGAMAVVWSALGLFIHKLVVTSSERAKLIQELEAARKELELAAERDAELAALRERERLARELHDSLGHGLVTLTVQLEAAQRLYTVDPARASALMEEMKGLTRKSTEQLRRSLAGLRAPGLGDRPLHDALTELCAETSKRTGLKVNCAVAPDSSSLSPALAEVLWRVAQEGLANIEKHARATTAEVHLEIAHNDGAETGRRSATAKLRVIDDGEGLPPEAEGLRGHYGLRGVRERVEGLGGVFSANGGAGKGTTLEARLPIHL